MKDITLYCSQEQLFPFGCVRILGNSRMAVDFSTGLDDFNGGGGGP